MIQVIAYETRCSYFTSSMNHMKPVIHAPLLPGRMTGFTSPGISFFKEIEYGSFDVCQKIMVLGLIRKTDHNTREMLESHISDDLRFLGYDVLGAFREFGPDAFEDLHEDVIFSKIRDAGVDAVLTIVLLKKEKETRRGPRKLNIAPHRDVYGHFWDYYRKINRRIDETRYYVADSRYYWESNLYDVRTQRLICSVQTDSFDPAGPGILTHEYGKLITVNMARSQVFGKVLDKSF